MPLPIFIIAGAVTLGTAGLGSLAIGAKKIKDTRDKSQSTKQKHEENIQKFEEKSQTSNQIMDDLGKKELEILQSFEQFSDLIEEIQNRPQFKTYQVGGVQLPKYNKEDLKDVWIGAGVLLGGLGGAAMGTAGGFAAAGATTAAVMALGTASTGTAIASLSGVAATNATLAALGGGALAAGGGGMALGATVLGTASLGVGLLVGGLIINFTANKLSDQAEEAHRQMEATAKTIKQICQYLQDLDELALDYTKTLDQVNNFYQAYMTYLSDIIIKNQKRDWNYFTDKEKIITENTVGLVGLLYKMCQLQLVKMEEDGELKSVNQEQAREMIQVSSQLLVDLNRRL